MDDLLLGSPAGQGLHLFTFAEPDHLLNTSYMCVAERECPCHSVDLPLLGISDLFTFVGHTIFS